MNLPWIRETKLCRKEEGTLGKELLLPLVIQPHPIPEREKMAMEGAEQSVPSAVTLSPASARLKQRWISLFSIRLQCHFWTAHMVQEFFLYSQTLGKSKSVSLSNGMMVAGWSSLSFWLLAWARVSRARWSCFWPLKEDSRYWCPLPLWNPSDPETTPSGIPLSSFFSKLKVSSSFYSCSDDRALRVHPPFIPLKQSYMADFSW